MTAKWRRLPCPTCGANEGDKCTLVGGLSNEYVTTPHRARLRAAGLRAEPEPKPNLASEVERFKRGLLIAREYFYYKGCDHDENGYVVHEDKSCCTTLRKIDEALDG